MALILAVGLYRRVWGSHPAVQWLLLPGAVLTCIGAAVRVRLLVESWRERRRKARRT